ncbi:hypothetical protein Cni_G05745 [Canna indica]|uniref:Uncharacterized protein n=1 Tax=Canna indica TaxID=4628 RepID=A0AAQ3JXM9_9LILI|nr:hypothetical protein Cni_G05745 [Canna indica]
MKLRILLAAAAALVFACSAAAAKAPHCQVELPAYVSASCAAADTVFEAFSVCCEFLRRAHYCGHLCRRVAAPVTDGWLRDCCLV